MTSIAVVVIAAFASVCLGAVLAEAMDSSASACAMSGCETLCRFTAGPDLILAPVPSVSGLIALVLVALVAPTRFTPVLSAQFVTPLAPRSPPVRS